MRRIVVYPSDKEIEISVFGDTPEVRGSFPYPECSCDIGAIVSTIEETLGIEDFDAGITTYGVIEPVHHEFLELTPERVTTLSENRLGTEKTNIASVILASLLPKKTYIAYPLTFNSLPEMSHLSGIPQITRRVVAHTLDHITVAKKSNKSKLLTVYLSDGEISTAAHVNGKILDITNSFDGEGPMTPTRSGFFHQRCVYKMALSGKFSKDDLISKIREKGGLLAHLGVSDLSEIRLKIKNGDTKAKLIYNAMIYQIAKSIGRMNPLLKDKAEALIFTGPLSKDDKLVSEIAEYIAYIGPISVANDFDYPRILDDILLERL